MQRESPKLARFASSHGRNDLEGVVFSFCVGFSRLLLGVFTRECANSVPWPRATSLITLPSYCPQDLDTYADDEEQKLEILSHITVRFLVVVAAVFLR